MSQASLVADTLTATPLGTFGGVAYTSYEAMFQGTASRNHPYRVPCQIIAPQSPGQVGRPLLFDWLNPTLIPTAVGRDFGLGRYSMTDAFLLCLGIVYATVRSDKEGIGRPWIEGTFNAAGESIREAGDEFEIVADFVGALSTDSLATRLAGPLTHKAGFGYSNSGGKLRGFVRDPIGQGVFEVSIAGGAGDSVHNGQNADPPPDGAGRSIEFNTETEVLQSHADRVRVDAPNLRVYEFAGCAHARQQDAFVLGLPDPEKTNPADWFGFIRAMLVAGLDWCAGMDPPPSIWLGARRDTTIARDAKKNALVRYVGGAPVDPDRYRLPEVAVGQNRYIAFDPDYRNAGHLRPLLGAFVDLTASITDHDAYVGQVTGLARELQDHRYLLKADADVIIRTASDSDIGK
jgi:hypothetical protein